MRSTKTAQYSQDDLRNAISSTLNGEKGTRVAKALDIPYKTLMSKVRSIKEGNPTEPRKRGPKPALPPPDEKHLVDWIGAMQMDGHPVDRRDIQIYATKILRQLG
ncbi:hypothetical protein LEN26_014421 [Aphanomyces euteiches]|nr:hypothetical protein LEN26_014421 [Aphanomyces euteiches]